jgi:hypothetical protein
MEGEDKKKNSKSPPLENVDVEIVTGSLVAVGLDLNNNYRMYSKEQILEFIDLVKVEID